MRALPSYYAGVVFRSRTEARWARYFDAMGLAWEYEPEGWPVVGGYLPDFWLPDLKAWVEVKPRCGFTRLQRLKCMELCERTGLRVLLLVGAPTLRPVEMLHPPGMLGPEDAGACTHWVGLWGKWLHQDGAPCYCGPEGTGDYDEDAVEAILAVRATIFTEPPAEAYAPLGWDGIAPVEGADWEGRQAERVARPGDIGRAG